MAFLYFLSFSPEKEVIQDAQKHCNGILSQTFGFRHGKATFLSSPSLSLSHCLSCSTIKRNKWSYIIGIIMRSLCISSISEKNLLSLVHMKTLSWSSINSYQLLALEMLSGSSTQNKYFFYRMKMLMKIVSGAPSIYISLRDGNAVLKNLSINLSFPYENCCFSYQKHFI